jgi:hypothetical protein
LSTTTEFRLDTNEKWSTKVILVLGGKDSYTKSLFEQTLQQEISTAQGQGIQASWQQVTDQSNGSNLTYQIKLSGTGYEGLNKVVFNGEQAVSKGVSADQLIFNMSPFGSFLGNGQQNSFSLIAGKILASNGIKKNNTTVTWINPSSTMSATVSTTPDLNIALIILVLIGLFILGIAIITIVRRGSARNSSHVQEPSIDLSHSDVLYCMNCGKKIPHISEFCPHCGQRTC